MLTRSLSTLIIVAIHCGTVHAQHIVDTSFAIKVGSIKQWVSVKGKDNARPLLLWLHGGPGGSVMNQSEKYTKKLQQYFLVVQWDQRETGQTLALNKSPQPLTLDLFWQDTHDVIDSLLRLYHREKLFLVGHSWGTCLGFHMADKYPELLYAYIAISPMIDQLKSERMTLAMLQDWAAKKGKHREAQELSEVHVPFATGEDLYTARRWLFAFNGQKIIALTFPRKFILSWSLTWLGIFNEASALDLFVTLPEIKCPVYFFAGAKDYQTHHTITQNYFDAVLASKKQLFWFEHAGHSIPDDEPESMQDTIINQILPMTFPK